MENGKAEIKKEEVANETTMAESVEVREKIEPVVENEDVVAEKKADVVKVDEAEKIVPTPDLLEKIKSQIEFYFGDINMQRDKFLIEQTKLDEGWVPMSVMLNFKILASLSKDIATILTSIEDSDLMEISQDRKKIRRRRDKPLPVYDENYRKAQTARTVYLKGFPLKETNIDKLKEYFKEWDIENIIMRKYSDEKKKLQFKGSIFLQFKKLEDAKAFLAQESVKYDGQELTKMSSEVYSSSKEKEREERKAKSASKTKSSEKVNNQAETDKTAAIELPEGSVLKFTGASDTTDWDSIKESLIELEANIAYVDYKIGAPHGWIRLLGTDAAETLLKKMTDNKLTIDGSDVTFQVLEGLEKEEYLKKVKSDMYDRKQKLNNRGRGKGRNKKTRGNHYQGKKRSGSPTKGDTPAKKIAV